MSDISKFIAIVITGFIVVIGGISFIEYQYDERNAELFNECIAVADTNEKLIACISQYGNH